MNVNIDANKKLDNTFYMMMEVLGGCRGGDGGGVSQWWPETQRWQTQRAVSLLKPSRNMLAELKKR